MIRRLVVLGASGDLTERYLAPALAELHSRGELPEGFTLHGIARSEWSDDEFRDQMRDALEEHAGDLDAGARRAVVEAITYSAGDVTQADDLRPVVGDSDEPVAVYLALPPGVVAPTVYALSEAGLPEGSQVVVEKPFGEDLDSARELNSLLHERFAEDAIFRVDHFLAEPAVQNLLWLRLANRMLEPAWSHEHVERVEITWDETLALEGRARYYDSAGALRDMVQNHLLQVLCVAAMEPPLNLDERELRDRKIDLLRSVRRLDPNEVDEWTVRARYTSGDVAGQDVPSYVEEEDVDPSRETETFASVEFRVDNRRWADVPFIVRTGKALSRDRHEIVVRFHPDAHDVFGAGGTPPGNTLRLEFEPARVHIGLNLPKREDGVAAREVELTGDPTPRLHPYSRVLLDILRGRRELSVRDDEAEEAWRVVEPILDAWTEGRSPLREYAAGSDGPATTPR